MSPTSAMLRRSALMGRANKAAAGRRTRAKVVRIPSGQALPSPGAVASVASAATSPSEAASPSTAPWRNPYPIVAKTTGCTRVTNIMGVEPTVSLTTATAQATSIQYGHNCIQALLPSRSSQRSTADHNE